MMLNGRHLCVDLDDHVITVDVRRSIRYFARESGSPWLNFIRISVGKGEIGPRRRRVPATLPRIRQGARRNLDITSRYASTVVEIGSHSGGLNLSQRRRQRGTVREHNSKERDMNTTHNVKRIIFGALLSGGVAVPVWGWAQEPPRRIPRANFNGAQGKTCRMIHHGPRAASVGT